MWNFNPKFSNSVLVLSAAFLILCSNQLSHLAVFIGIASSKFSVFLHLKFLGKRIVIYLKKKLKEL